MPQLILPLSEKEQEKKKSMHRVIAIYAASGENSCDNPGAKVRHWSIYQVKYYVWRH